MADYAVKWKKLGERSKCFSAGQAMMDSARKGQHKSPAVTRRILLTQLVLIPLSQIYTSILGNLLLLS